MESTPNSVKMLSPREKIGIQFFHPITDLIEANLSERTSGYKLINKG